METKKRSDFETEKEWLLHKQKVLQARLNEIDKEDNAQKRKDETRKKIILVGGILALQTRLNEIDQKDQHLFPKLFK